MWEEFFLKTNLLYTHLSLLTLFFCFFVLFNSCSSHARVFGRTIVHEFLNTYGHTKSYLLFPTAQLHVHKRRSRRDSVLSLANHHWIYIMLNLFRETTVSMDFPKKFISNFTKCTLYFIEFKYKYFYLYIILCFRI